MTEPCSFYSPSRKGVSNEITPSVSRIIMKQMIFLSFFFFFFWKLDLVPFLAGIPFVPFFWSYLNLFAIKVLTSYDYFLCWLLEYANYGICIIFSFWMIADIIKINQIAGTTQKENFSERLKNFVLCALHFLLGWLGGRISNFKVVFML